MNKDSQWRRSILDLILIALAACSSGKVPADEAIEQTAQIWRGSPPDNSDACSTARYIRQGIVTEEARRLGQKSNIERLFGPSESDSTSLPSQMVDDQAAKVPTVKGKIVVSKLAYFLGVCDEKYIHIVFAFDKDDKLIGDGRDVDFVF